jgi:hypothetical protein
MTIFNKTKTIEKALTISTSAYSAGDVVGGLITVNVASAGGGGVLRRLILTDEGNIGAVLTVYMFCAPPTMIANDAAFASAIVAADMKKKRATIAIAAADYETINSIKQVTKDGDDLNVDFNADDGNLYFYIVCTATPDYLLATDLTFTVILWLD